MKIDFFTPIHFKNPTTVKQHIQEAVDDYFYLSGKSVQVIKSNKTAIIEEPEKITATQVGIAAIKILSYITLIIPLIMLAAKAALRPSLKGYIITNATENKTQIPEQILRTVTPPSSSKNQLSVSDEQNLEEQSQSGQDYYTSYCEQASFWDCCLDSYITAIKDEQDNVQYLLFLNEELLAIKNDLEQLLNNVNNLPPKQQEKTT